MSFEYAYAVKVCAARAPLKLLRQVRIRNARCLNIWMTLMIIKSFMFALACNIYFIFWSLDSCHIIISRLTLLKSFPHFVNVTQISYNWLNLVFSLLLLVQKPWSLLIRSKHRFAISISIVLTPRRVLLEFTYFGWQNSSHCIATLHEHLFK